MSLLERLKEARIVGTVKFGQEYFPVVGVSQADRDTLVKLLEAAMDALGEAA